MLRTMLVSAVMALVLSGFANEIVRAPDAKLSFGVSGTLRVAVTKAGEFRAKVQVDASSQAAYPVGPLDFRGRA